MVVKKIRAFVKEKLVNSVFFRPLIKIGLNSVVSLELFYERTLDLLHKTPGQLGDVSHATAVIKTFERPKKLQRLVSSIRRTFPMLKIIIVDDSRNPISLSDTGIERVTLPYDSGVSAGRAAGLERVTTPYVINLDDDYIFSRKTRLIHALAYLERNNNVDLVAGEVTYLPYYIRFDYTTHKLMNYQSNPLYEKGTEIDGLKVFEKCANFFVARTDKLKSVGWDPNLKRLDHADFYTRARGKITTVFDPDMELLHDQTHFDQNYLKVRHDYSQDSKVLNDRYSANKKTGDKNS
ncbi:MAG: glycosyltransferase [Pseudomonadota bacterium]